MSTAATIEENNQIRARQINHTNRASRHARTNDVKELATIDELQNDVDGAFAGQHLEALNHALVLNEFHDGDLQARSTRDQR